MIDFTSEFDVEFIQGTGSDAIVAAAARVSTGLNLDEYSTEDNAKLISYLVKHRHGSPFEHGSMTFRISAPIFVFREFMRHRIGWSYNETSARYKQLDPKFYLYPEERPLIQDGSSAHPNLVAGTPHMTESVNGRLELLYGDAWNAYTSMIEDGVAYEVARAVLPVGIYSEMYVTCNARSMMAFLSLRVDAENARFETKPQWEIEQVAKKMEEYFALLYPATYDSFNNHGRVAP